MVNLWEIYGESMVNLWFTGWWLSHPSEKYELVNWDDELPNMWENHSHVPNHQPDNRSDRTNDRSSNFSTILVSVSTIFLNKLTISKGVHHTIVSRSENPLLHHQSLGKLQTERRYKYLKLLPIISLILHDTIYVCLFVYRYDAYI